VIVLSWRRAGWLPACPVDAGQTCAYNFVVNSTFAFPQTTGRTIDIGLFTRP
jgi:hypothetical protein